MPQATDDGAARRLFKNGGAWKAWLAKNHDKQKGIWLLFYKKGSGKTSITYPEALDEALCYGWIDSIVKKCDEENTCRGIRREIPGACGRPRTKGTSRGLSAKAG